MIVIGGGVASAGDRYLATIRQTVYRRSLPLATRNLQIVPSGLGPMAGVVGAAAMVADELFSLQQLAGTLARHAAHRAGAGYPGRRPTRAEGTAELVGSGPKPA